MTLELLDVCVAQVEQNKYQLSNSLSVCTLRYLIQKNLALLFSVTACSFSTTKFSTSSWVQ